MYRLTKTAVLLASVIIGFTAAAQEPSYMERADRYDADSLGQYLNNLLPNITWLKDCSKMAYKPTVDGGHQYYIVDTKTWKPRRYKDEASFEKAVDRLKCKKEQQGSFYNKLYYRSYSSDSLYYMTVLKHDLYLHNTFTGDSTRLTTDGEPYASYTPSGNKGRCSSSWCAPIGRWIGDTHKYVLLREDHRNVKDLYLVNSLTEGRPELVTYRYAMPADSGVVQYNIMLADADAAEIYGVYDYRFKDQIYKAPRFSKYPCSKDCAWFLRVSRTCDTLELCRLNAMEKKLETVISEVCKPHYNEQLHNYHILSCGQEIIWWSERTGKGQYYLYDAEGQLIRQVTEGDFVCGQIVDIDPLARTIIFEGYGREKGINPHYRFYYKASLDGEFPIQLLTPGNGDHKIEFSPDKRFIVDNWSRMDQAPQHQICDKEGNVLFRMQGCDMTKMFAHGWQYPEVISLKAADGKTDLWGVVYLPFDIEPGRKYPIISSVYPGPHTDLVPQEFFLDDNYNQSLAQLGFIVINFSYRGGCPYRGHDYYNYGYGNLRDYALEDDYAVIQQIAERYPFADLDRVGIYGHSGGGFMTVAAMLARPDFYKVGVAASGNHDNNIYTQWWGESFHGVKNNGGKFETKIPTNIDNAGKLKGRLLLITGDMDNNVHPANTMRLAHALIRNHKRFDMMVIPGADHGLGDKYYFNLIRYYFTEHLLGLPQKDIDIVEHK